MMRIIRTLVIFATLLVACGDPSDDTVNSNTTEPSLTLPGGTIPANAGTVFVDTTDILLMESFPVQVALRVNGNLPTPCHEPVWEVDDDGSTISVTLASVADPDVACIQVLAPFELSIPLGSFESGAREVILNGEKVGDFEI
jgi:hypothetical protein